VSRLDPKYPFLRPGGSPNRPGTVRDFARRKSLPLPGLAGRSPNAQLVLSTERIERMQHEQKRSDRERPRPMVLWKESPSFDLLEVNFSTGDEVVSLETEDFEELSLKPYQFLIVDILWGLFKEETVSAGDTYSSFSYTPSGLWHLKQGASNEYSVSLGPFSTSLTGNDDSPSNFPPTLFSTNQSHTIPSLADNLIWIQDRSDNLTDMECVGCDTGSNVYIYLFKQMPGYIGYVE